MRIALDNPRGEVPRVAPQLLPENAAQQAINARLQSGNLESWRQFAFIKALANGADVETIYKLNDRWLSWTVDVDVARGAIPGDNTYRVYLTGPDLYDQPRFTNYALATTGSEPFPVTTRPLGVPAPDSIPTLVAGISTLAGDTITETLDNGDQLSTAWTTTPSTSLAFTRSIVSQDASTGNDAPSYKLDIQENNDYPCALYRDFGVADSTSVFVSFDFKFNNSDKRRMLAHLLTTASGAGAFVRWADGVLMAGVGSEFSEHGLSTLASVAIGSAADGVWYTCQVSIITNSNNTRTLRVAIYNGSAQIGTTLTMTNAFTQRGGLIGFSYMVAEHTTSTDAGEDGYVWYDNILVRGTAPADTIVQTPTSYVYTFVNDLDEESAPSLPSATILKDDGMSITVTTSVSLPTGLTDDYSLQSKNIYRAVIGSTGTTFKFVANIPLSQADYVDELTDSELGDDLESDDWDLPPDDLKGLLALPNGIMVGFRRNQLCFSVQNRPHAWPVKWRLNTDTDIVGIGNIDTTVVIGTEAFPYLAIGNDPSAYSMTKLEVPQACVSKRSVAYLTGIGVVFASPDGIIAVAGNGSVRNLTESVFTRRQWQALSPESIVAVAHDDVYHFFYNTELSNPFTFTATPADITLAHNIDYFPGPTTSSAAAAPQNQWTLLEVLRNSSGTVQLLVNSVVRAEYSNYTANVGSGQRTYDIGSFDNAQEFFQGYIDRVRVVENGVTRLSIDFDGPDGSTTFTDNAGSSLTGQNGVAQSNTQAYEGSFSAHFSNGSNQNIASDRTCNIGTGTFSFSAAVYPTADVSPGQRVISAQDVVSISPLATIRVNSGGLVQAMFRDPSGNNLLILNSSTATSGPIATLSASESIDLSISSSTNVPPGLTVVLSWDGTSGSVGLRGTPTTPGTYNMVITYVNSTTGETLGTSANTVIVT